MAGKDGRLSWPVAQTSAVDLLGLLADPGIHVRCALGGAHRELPTPIFVEPRLAHLGVEADAPPQLELLGHVLEVGQQVGLGGEPRRPVVGLCEGEALELVGHVDVAPGVDVLEPRAPDLAVLLEKTVTSTPAWRSLCAAASPEAPAPTTAQRNASTSLGDIPRRSAAGRSPVNREFFGQERFPCGR